MKLLLPISLLLLIAFSSCRKSYSCTCINENSMAAIAPQETYKIKADSKDDAKAKCEGVKEVYNYWSSCTVIK